MEGPWVLIGMFDSPFVRRVAISLKLLGLPFEHRNWSVGRDFERIREFNPLGRVPTLVLEDGESLVESAAILDYLDDRVGAERALVPATGASRRAVLRLMAIAVGAAEKGVLQVYERVFRPEPKRHEEWVQRCRTQMHGALTELERLRVVRDTVAGAESWWVGERMTQADVTVACVFTFLREALAVDQDGTLYPALTAATSRCESLAAFREIKDAFIAPG